MPTKEIEAAIAGMTHRVHHLRVLQTAIEQAPDGPESLLWQRTLAVFHSAEFAARWLLTENAFVGNRTPLAAWEAGDVEMVTDLLGRIEHGIHA